MMRKKKRDQRSEKKRDQRSEEREMIRR